MSIGRLAVVCLVLFQVGFMNLEFVDAQKNKTIRDESKVPAYELPDALVRLDGVPVADASGWEDLRRNEVLQLFKDHVYGNMNTGEIQFSHARKEEAWTAEQGLAKRFEIELTFQSSLGKHVATLLVTVPKIENGNSRVPCFLGLNFNGNHTTTDDERVSITESWVRNNKGQGSSNNRALKKDRGGSSSRWPYADLVKAGYAVATMYYGDIDPDFDDGFKNGIHAIMPKSKTAAEQMSAGGSIAAWAWALSRCLDCLEHVSEIDGDRVAVLGHSRLGKTALWAGANDPRFWITISNNSGCGGAALHRRAFGETVEVINRNFPHWFCDRFATYSDKENEIPVDQHMLVGLIAPRGVYVASASKDSWADPKGEFLSLVNSNGVFQLYGEKRMSDVMPAPGGSVVSGNRGYHLREGKHDIKKYDWDRFVQFADRIRSK